MLTQHLLLALPTIGGIAFVVGFVRVFSRADIDLWVGWAEQASYSRADKDARTARLWAAFMDPAHPADRILVVGGFLLGLALMVGTQALLPLLAPSNSPAASG